MNAQLVRVSGHNLETWGVYKPVSNLFCSKGGGKIRLQRLLWIARRKTFKTLVQNTSKNSASREESKFVSFARSFQCAFLCLPYRHSVGPFRLSSCSSACTFSFQFALSTFSVPCQLSVYSFSFQYALSAFSLSFQFVLLAFSWPFQLLVCPFSFQFALSAFSLPFRISACLFTIPCLFSICLWVDEHWTAHLCSCILCVLYLYICMYIHMYACVLDLFIIYSKLVIDFLRLLLY